MTFRTHEEATRSPAEWVDYARRLEDRCADLEKVLEHVRDAMEASGGWDGDEECFARISAVLKH